MYDSVLPIWIRSYYDIIDKCKLNGHGFYRNDKHYDAIIGLIHVSVKNNKANQDKFLEKDLVKYVSRILVLSDINYDRYIKLLQLI